MTGAVTGLLQATNNLSDVSDAGSSRSNIHVPVLTPAAVVATNNISSLSGNTAIDGYSPAATDLILLTAQSTASQNGLWLVPSGGGAWTRPTEFATAAVIKGRTCRVLNGTTNSGTDWTLVTPTAGITVGTSSQTWTNTLLTSTTANAAYVPVVQGSLAFGWLNVTDSQWGLACDGATDDSVAFQTLITNNPGKTIWIPPSIKIYLTTTINLAKGTIIKGNAVRQSQTTDATLLFNNAGDGLSAIDGTSGATWKILIEGVSIQQLNTANTGAGIRTEKAWDVHICHCSFSNGSGTNNYQANWQVGIRKAHGLHNNIEDVGIQLRGPNSASCV